MLEIISHLSSDGIKQLMQGSTDDEKVILQITNLCQNKNGKLSCFISDGTFSLKSLINDAKPIKTNKNQIMSLSNNNCIIAAKGHVISDNKKNVGILDMELLYNYAEVVGNPIEYHKAQAQNPQHKGSNLLKMDMIINNKSSISTIKTEDGQNRIKKQQNRVVLPLKGSIQEYETIKDLFVGLERWHLLCRVVMLKYQEKIRKNNKLTKILNVQLMDRSEMKINGVCFGDAANQLYEKLVQNSVYKICKGNIVAEDYINTRNQRLSAFKLIFNAKSQFEEISDLKIIANVEDTAFTLKQVIDKQIMDQQFDIIGILVQMQQAVELTKGDSRFFRRNLVIVDPVAQISILAVTWREQITPDPALLNKAIMLSRFKLKNYNGSLTLNPTYRSIIKPVVQHPYTGYEQKAFNDHIHYEKLSIQRENLEDNASPVCQNLKQLRQQINRMGTTDTVRSEVYVWVNRMALKKWYYQGCPHCNRAAQQMTTCSSCNKYVQNTVAHFIIGVEISDPYASIWITAYDELGKKLFNMGNTAIDKLKQLDDTELKQATENYLYQELKLKLYTKKNEQGKFKHQVGKIMDSKIYAQDAQINLARIQELV